MFVRTLYLFCRDEYRARQPSDELRRGLLRILVDRITSLAGEKVGYGEQRLLTHMCSSMLSGFVKDSAGSASTQRFVDAMRIYAASARDEDAFAAACQGWLKLVNLPLTDITTERQAMKAIGHWDPLIRLKASLLLARQMSGSSEVSARVLGLLQDTRDEVRAAAAVVIGHANVADTAEEGATAKRLAKIVLNDRGLSLIHI